MYAHPLQGRLHPELAALGVLLHPPRLDHRPEVHLGHAPRPARGPVSEPLLAFLLEAPPDPVGGGPVHLQVARDALVRPAFQAQCDRGLPALPVVGDLVIGREAPDELARDRALLEHGLHRLAVGPAPEEGAADVGDLLQVQRGMLGLEVHDYPADGRGQHPTLGFRRGEEALHALLAEGRYLAVEHPFRDPGFRRPLEDRPAEEHQRPDPFVLPLLLPDA